MTKKIYTSYDFDGNEIINLRPENVVSNPAFGLQGKIIYNITKKALCLDVGDGFVTLINDVNLQPFVDSAQQAASEAETNRLLAEAAKISSENARDMAITGASGFYADTASGIAATSDGDLFLVQGAGDTFATLFMNDAGTAVSQSLELASSTALDTLRGEAGLDAPKGYGDTLSADAPTGGIGGVPIILEPGAATVASVLHKAEIQADAAGTAYLFVVTVSGTTVTVVDKKAFTLTTGFNTVTPNMDVPAGAFVAFGGQNVIGTYGSGAVARNYGGNVSAAIDSTFTLNASTLSTIYGVNMYVIDDDAVLGRVVDIESRLDTAETDIKGVQSDIMASGGVTGSEGWIGDIANATPTASLGKSYNLIDPDAMTLDGTVKRLKVWLTSAATVFVRSYTKTGTGALANGDTMTVRNSQEVSCAAGYNDIAVDVDFKSGDYVGIHAPGGNLQTAGSGNPNATFYGGSPSSSLTLTLANSSNTQFLFQLDTESTDTGLKVDVEKLREDVDALQSAPGSSGVLLDAGVGYRLPALGALSVKAHLYASVSGQSNARGADTAITTITEYGALGFSNNAATVLSLGSATVGGDEYPGFGLAAYLREQLMFGGGVSQSDASKIIVGRAALGGTKIEDLDKGSAVYSNNQSQLSAAASYAGPNEFRHLGQAWFQGEADAGAATTRAAYKALFKALASDFDTDSKALVAGAYDRPTFAIQVSSPIGWVTLSDGWEIAMAQYEGATESDLISIVGPSYQIPYSDDRHLSSEGYRVSGALFARAMFSFAATGILFEPLHVVEAKISGDNVVLYYNKPDLVKDTTLVPAQIDNGFKVNNGTSDVTINSVTVERNTVTLELASTPVSGWAWSYGNLQATGLLPYFGGAGNIRDGAGAHDQIDGTPLHNWAVLQEGLL